MTTFKPHILWAGGACAAAITLALATHGWAEKGQAGDKHAGHRSRLKRDAQSVRQRCRGCLCGSHVGTDRDVHTDIAGCTG